MDDAVFRARVVAAKADMDIGHVAVGDASAPRRADMSASSRSSADRYAVRTEGRGVPTRKKPQRSVTTAKGAAVRMSATTRADSADSLTKAAKLLADTRT
jgi:hypothetical protein